MEENGATNGQLSEGSLADEPDWDDEKAREIIGKRVLISITTEDDSGEFVSRWQAYGIVMRADQSEGCIAVDLEGVHMGQETTLPPMTSAFEPAERGIYSLPESGEEVQNPDYTVQYTMTLPPDA